MHGTGPIRAGRDRAGGVLPSIGTMGWYLKVTCVSDDARSDLAPLPGRPTDPTPGRPEEKDGHACPAQSTHHTGRRR